MSLLTRLVNDWQRPRGTDLLAIQQPVAYRFLSYDNLRVLRSSAPSEFTDADVERAAIDVYHRLGTGNRMCHYARKHQDTVGSVHELNRAVLADLSRQRDVRRAQRDVYARYTHAHNNVAGRGMTNNNAFDKTQHKNI